MIASIFFILTRFTQLLFLIPMLGMLSYLIHGYVEANTLTPTFILVIFIVTVLASVWAAGTLVFYAVARKSGWFIALIDFGIFCGFIGAVATLRRITSLDCSNVSTTGYWALNEVPFIYELNKVCGLLKASFALAILEILFFFWSFILALFVEHHYERKTAKESRRETTTYSRRSSSRRPGSRDYRSSYYGGAGGAGGAAGGGSRSGSRARSGSRHGQRSSYYSDRRSYV